MRGCPRYLTKLCNNIVALVSPEDYSKIVWHDDQEKSMEEAQMMGDDLDISGRFMSFEVVKTSEQEENITAQFGFTVCISLLCRSPSFLIDLLARHHCYLTVNLDQSFTTLSTAIF